MYRSELDAKDKSGALAGVLAIHAALALAFLHLSDTPLRLTDPQRSLRVFDVREIVPPPTPLQKPSDAEMPKEKEGGSPPNIRSEATPIVAPTPMIRLTARQPVVVTETPRQGAAPTQGAAEVPGPGTGTGGFGTGTGTGTGGGAGGGGGGGIAMRPSLVRGIVGRDYPRAILWQWPPGGRIYLRLRIEPNGRPSQCDVMRSYGDPVADEWTCRLVMERGVFRPARNERGLPVAAWFGYVQEDARR